MAATTGRLQIPRSDYPKLRALLTLSDENLGHLMSAIQDTDAALPLPEFARRIAAKANIDPQLVGDVVDVLISLYSVRLDSGLDVPEFIDLLQETIDATGREDLIPADGNWEPLKERLNVISQLQSIFITTKAIDLRLRNQRTFIDAQIVTDLRPIFDADSGANVAAAIIIHGLRITYIEDRETRDFFVTLDGADIHTLRSLLNRAESKASNLAKIIDQSSVPLIGEEQ